MINKLTAPFGRIGIIDSEITGENSDRSKLFSIAEYSPENLLSINDFKLVSKAHYSDFLNQKLSVVYSTSRAGREAALTNSSFIIIDMRL